MKKLLWGMLFSLLLATSAFADSWLPPSVQSYSSANGEWKLTVYPRGLTNQLNYFKTRSTGSRMRAASPAIPRPARSGTWNASRAGAGRLRGKPRW